MRALKLWGQNFNLNMGYLSNYSRKLAFHYKWIRWYLICISELENCAKNNHVFGVGRKILPLTLFRNLKGMERSWEWLYHGKVIIFERASLNCVPSTTSLFLTQVGCSYTKNLTSKILLIPNMVCLFWHGCKKFYTLKFCFMGKIVLNIV